ncbi:armadillo repeat-containing protein 5 [Bombina bombina]|uniref:armadillo repeat-containing protein 5 n=1 Tax=Bombina bombina TaxID=8345 RepID=UPI00235A97B3|nr:armadillo repeat-containing protein 5 [Bombina bombina]
MSGDSLASCLARLAAAADDPSGLSHALSALRSKHVHRAGGMGLFRKNGGLTLLLALLTDPPRAAALGASRRNLELALSLLANSCTEPGSREQVRQLGGIPALVCILQSVCVDSVLNRVSRALGNLALDPQNSSIIHQSGAVSSLVHILQSSQDAGCVHSCLRALRILGDSPAHRLSICEQGGLSPCVSFLTSPDPALVCAAVRAVCELSRSCSLDCAEQLNKAVPVLVGMGQGEEVKPVVRQAALSTLCNLCTQGAMRPMLGNAGTVRLLISEIRNLRKSPTRCLPLVKALCLCCREALNRLRVREEGGLELFLELLRDPQYRCSHPRIIAAFLHFCHDIAALVLLGMGGLAVLLAERLEDLAKSAEMKGDLPEPASVVDKEEERASASFDFPPEPKNKRPRESRTSEDCLRSWLLSEGFIGSLEELSPEWSLDSDTSGCSVLDEVSPLTYPDLPAATCVPVVLPPDTTTGPPTALTTSNSDHCSATPASASLACINPSCLDLLATTSVPTSQCLITPVIDQCRSLRKSAGVATGLPLVTPTSSNRSVAPSRSLCSLKPTCLNLSSSPVESHTKSDAYKVIPSQSRGSRFLEIKKRPVPSSQQLSSPVQEILKSPWPLKSSWSPPTEYWRPEVPSLLLLSRFSQLADASSSLVSPQVLSCLLTYVTIHPYPSPRAARLLQRLTCDPSCLEAFIRTGSICTLRARLILDESPDGSQSCRHPERTRELGHVLLRNLCIQAESPFGVGTVTHMLLSGSQNERQQCALSLPYIYRKDSSHRQQLLEGALRLILEPLMECVDSVFAFHASECLSYLSHQSLSAPCPSPPIPPLHCLYLERISHGGDVVFVLDGGECVMGNREDLISSCEVFRAMLEGGYAESHQMKIRVREVLACAFIPLLHYLHGCAQRSPCPLLQALTLLSPGQELAQSPLGSTLAAAGRFLVPGLQILLESMVGEHILALENLASIYRFAEIHESPGLRKDCCVFLLKRPHPPRKRSQCLLQLCQTAQDKQKLSQLLEETVQDTH